jgi:PHD/YefM family antitoxin component YafN of YafNO toxin-antitoxin module
MGARKELTTMPHIIPIRDLKNTSAISQMCQESTEPVYITKNDYGDMVIMSMKAYEEKLFMADVYAKLAEAETEIAEGKTSDARLGLEELREKYGL